LDGAAAAAAGDWLVLVEPVYACYVPVPPFETGVHAEAPNSMPSLLWLLLPDPLPVAWFNASGMSNLRAFICQSCRWPMAADPSYAGWSQLAYLDISWNPLFALDPILNIPLTWLGNSTNVLPIEWETISLSVLRVRLWLSLCCCTWHSRSVSIPDLLACLAAYLAQQHSLPNDHGLQ
jgi:hypothetical protein